MVFTEFWRWPHHTTPATEERLEAGGTEDNSRTKTDMSWKLKGTPWCPSASPTSVPPEAFRFGFINEPPSTLMAGQSLGALLCVLRFWILQRERECEWFIIVGREMSMQIIGPMHTDSYIMFHPHTYTNTHTRAHTHSTTVSIKFTYLHDNMYFLNIYIICICILCEYVGVRS